MNWISHLFFAACLCSISGTLAFLEWKLLLPILERWRPSLASSMLKLVVFQFLFPAVYGIMVLSRIRYPYEQMVGVLFVPTALISIVLKLLAAIWLITILLRLPKQVHKYLRAREVLRGNVPVELEGAQEIFLETCRELGIRRKVHLFANDLCYSPVRIRLVRPAVLIPYGMKCDEQELRMIFIHELTHYLHHDLGFKFACFLIQILHWFNPCVRNLIEHYEEWAETACDISTCELGKPYFSQREYSLMLLNHTEADNEKDPKGNSMMLYSGKNKLERRIERLKTMKKGKKPFSKVMITALAAVLFAGNCIPAYAASDVLTNGYKEFYENTSTVRAETEEIDLPSDLKGYEVNDAGEIVIPADEFNPEGWPETEMEGSDKQRTAKFYDWSVPANEYSRSFGFTCKAGDSIAISVKSDYQIQAGIIEPSGDRRCVIKSGVFSHTFALDQSGTYHFYVKNTYDFEIQIQASVMY